MIRAVFDYGVVGRAMKKGVLQINPVDLRDFTADKHRSVDGTPFGGGPGMVMRVDVIDRTLQAISHEPRATSHERIVLLSPQGKLFNQQVAREYSKLDHLILISGRYEGVDERVKEHLVDEELSIGNYVLSGGEIPAMVVADSAARLIPGVVGNEESLTNESFSSGPPTPYSLLPTPVLDFPQYTQPVEYNGWKVPDILRSGNHQKIQEWREKQSKLKTTQQRFDSSSSQARRGEG